jgi:DNA topoisomerase IA
MVTPMNILIVESKAKCKTLQKYLGKDEWRVMPTGGHVEPLAEDKPRAMEGVEVS